MDNVELLYDIKHEKLNKKLSWYYYKDNVVFLTGEQFKEFNYIIEAEYNTFDSTNLIIILSKNKINDKCTYIYKDSYGRLKYKPVAFKNIFKKISNGKNFNVTLRIDRATNDYVAYELIL